MNEEESVLGLLYKQMEDEKQAIHAAIVQGTAHSYDEYKGMCGRIYGMSFAQGLINDMADKLRRQAA